MSSLPLYTPAASNSMHINKEKLHSIRETSSKKNAESKKSKNNDYEAYILASVFKILSDKGTRLRREGTVLVTGKTFVTSTEDQYANEYSKNRHKL